ncbi:MazG nucleotide pyrophosphohydrolase domain-containing protein [Arthrobacter pigmenti]
MGSLTHESLVEYLIEESYELVEAIEHEHSDGELAGELGDVLLQVVLHARLAEESGRFDIADVVASLTGKMIRRNPHVFTPDGGLRQTFPATVDEIVERWHHVKRQEKPERTSVFDGIPAGLPALALAAKTIRRAASGKSVADPGGQGNSQPNHGGTAGPRPLSSDPPTFSNEQELGDYLLQLVRRSTDDGMDPERALRTAVVRFQGRMDL